MAVEDVVSKNEGHGGVADKVSSDEKGLGKALGTGLLGIAQLHAVAGAVTEEAFEKGDVLGR